MPTTSTATAAGEAKNDMSKTHEEDVAGDSPETTARAARESVDDASGRRSGRKPKDTGLDGGYWSQMPVDDSARRKRQRNNVERLDLSKLDDSRLDSSSEYLHDETSRTDSLVSSSAVATTSTTPAKAAEPKRDRCVLFKKKSFITVLNDQNGFYLCQTLNSIYEDSKRSKIQWLEETDANKYKYGLDDWIDPFSIISKVKVSRVPGSSLLAIDADDLKKVNRLLDKALKEGGITVDFDEEEDSSSGEESIVDLNNKDVYDMESSDDDEDEKQKKKGKKRLSGDAKKAGETSEDEPRKKRSNKLRVSSDDLEDFDEMDVDERQIKPRKSTIKKMAKVSPRDEAKAITKSSMDSAKKPPKSDGEVVKKKVRLVEKDEETDHLESESDDERAKKKKVKASRKESPKASKTEKKSSPTGSKKSAAKKPIADSTLLKKRNLFKVLSNRLLEENVKVEVYTKDPFFEDDDSKAPVPFISPGIQAKLAFRAIYQMNLGALKKLIEDEKRVPSVHIGRCAYNNMLPAEFAIYMEFKPALELLINDFVTPRTKKRVQMPETMLSKFTNGTYNPRSLGGGVRFIRKLTESRGVKEGNDAFTKDQDNFDILADYDTHEFFAKLVKFAFDYGAPVDIYDFIIAKWKESNKGYSHYGSDFDQGVISECIVKIVISGHRKLAAHVLENAQPGIGFNAIHLEVLKAENDEELKSQLRANMCTKKPYTNDQATPIHFACINPNAKYLRTLLGITQEFTIADKKGRRPVHYAAVCEGPGPLEYLATCCSLNELDSMGNTPLHYACLTGRSANAEFLLSQAQRKQENDSVQTTEIVMDNKFGLGGINKPNKRGRLPLHFAISRNNYDCVKVLIKYGCNYEYPLPNSMGKITPLMYACQLGHFKIVQILYENRARIEARDRYKKTALMHAAMCGNARVMSFLLRKGANPNAVDSSGNSVLHYACAYGWYYCVKLLLEAGAAIDVSNEWKLNPFGIAFLKGHTGICDQLVKADAKKIDINFRTENGQTLIMFCVSSVQSMTDSCVDQLDYIINKLGGDATLTDSEGGNAFHYLASNKIADGLVCVPSHVTGEALERKTEERKIQERLRERMMEILLKAGCDASAEKDNFNTPLLEAMWSGNLFMARYLIKHREKTRCVITKKLDEYKNTFLHVMAEMCAQDMCSVIFGADRNDKQVFKTYEKMFQEMASMRDEDHLTPFQIVCTHLSQANWTTPSCPKADNITELLVFLYKDCKANPNDTLYYAQNKYYGKAREDASDHRAPIFEFVANDRVGVFNKLVQTMKKSPELTKIDFGCYNRKGRNVLMEAIVQNQTQFAINLLDNDFYTRDQLANQQSQNEKEDLNENLLQLAVRHLRIDVFWALVKKMTASKSKSSDVANFLEMLKYQNAYGQNFLHLIAAMPAHSRAHFNLDFLSQLTESIDGYFDEGNEVIARLVSQKDKLGRTPVHLCLLSREDNTAEMDLEMFFLKNGECKGRSIFFEKDFLERMPVHYLFYNVKQFDAAIFDTADLYAIEDFDKKLKEVSHKSLYIGQRLKAVDPVEILSIVMNLMEHKSLDEKDVFGYTPLHYAAIRGSTISCTMLIAKGCDMMSRAKAVGGAEGNTPLSSAIFFCHETCVLTLLRSLNELQSKPLRDSYSLDPREFVFPDGQLVGVQDAKKPGNTEHAFLKPKLGPKADFSEKNVTKKVSLYNLILKNHWEGISWLILDNLANYGLTYVDAITAAVVAKEFSMAYRLVEKFKMAEGTSLIKAFNQAVSERGRTILHLVAPMTLNDAQWSSLRKLLENVLKPSQSQDKSQQQLVNDLLRRKDDFGSTALHYACLAHNFKLIDFILEHSNSSFSNGGGDYLLFKLEDASQQSAYSLFYWKLGSQFYSPELRKKIKSYTSKKDQLAELMSNVKAHYSLSTGLEFNSTFVAQERTVFDYPRDKPSAPSQLISPLLFAINKLDGEMVQFLVKELEFDVNTHDYHKVNALTYAIRVNSPHICKLLLNPDYVEDLKKELADKSASAVPTTGVSSTRVKGADRLPGLFQTLIPSQSSSLFGSQPASASPFSMQTTTTSPAQPASGYLGTLSLASASSSFQPAQGLFGPSISGFMSSYQGVTVLPRDEPGARSEAESFFSTIASSGPALFDGKRPTLTKAASLAKSIPRDELTDEEESDDDENDEEDDEEAAEIQDLKENSEVQQDDEVFHEVKVKTNIVLNFVDQNSKTVFHHLASPLVFGSYDNLEIYKILSTAYQREHESKKKLQPLADILKRIDHKVKTAADYALMNGNIKLAQELEKATAKSVVDVSKIGAPVQVNDPIRSDLETKPNYMQDSEAFLKAHKQPATSAKSGRAGHFVVDERSRMGNTGMLVWDSKADVPYDVILTKTDLAYGFTGIHNFYKMQLITQKFHHNEPAKKKNGNDDDEPMDVDGQESSSTARTKFDESKMCVLFTRWGSIGDEGQFQRTPFSNFADAKAEFCKIFKQKTGNDFNDTVIEKKKPFEQKLKRYNLVQLEIREKSKLKDIDFELFHDGNEDALFDQSRMKSACSTKQTAALFKSFMVDLMNVSYLKKQIQLNSNISDEYLPLTQLSPEIVEKAQEVLLKEIKPLTEKRMELEKKPVKEVLQEYSGVMAQLFKLSNKYYELIPQSNFNFERLSPITSEKELNEQLGVLDQLNHAHVAIRIMMGARLAMSEMIPSVNPFDYLYSALDAKFEALGESDPETEYILRYITSEPGTAFRVKSIFRFERNGEQDRYNRSKLPSGEPKSKNRALLWHGTGVENLVSIINKGLIKTPNNARHTGARFGRGIYFSDSFSASTGYTRGPKRTVKEENGASSTITSKYMLLCEVALGKQREVRSSHEAVEGLPTGFDSIKALGRVEPDPKFNVFLPSGVMIPLGGPVAPKLKPNESVYSRPVQKSQYVVFDEAQVCIRYIVHFFE